MVSCARIRDRTERYQDSETGMVREMPHLPHDNALLALAVLLIGSLSAGTLAKRFRLPSVTGQILVGILLGPAVLDLFNIEVVHGLQPLMHFALGLIAVAVGNHLNLRRLRNAGKRLGLLIALESTLTPVLVFGTLVLTGAQWSLSILLAAMAVSTAPATIVALVKETRARGVMVKTLVAAVALNNLACISLFELARSISQMDMVPGTVMNVGGVAVSLLREFGLATVIGAGIGLLLEFLTRREIASDRLATASLVAIFLTSGLADALGVSSLMACIFLGITLANVNPDRDEIGHHVFANFESAVFAVFFALAGMELDFSLVPAGGLLALLVVVSRGAGKILSARVAMALAGTTERVKRNLGPALIPQAGVAVGLILVIRKDPVFAGIADMLLAVGLTSVLINEIIGPIMCRAALERSGDTGGDQSHLTDVVGEENIVTDLRDGAKEEVLRNLAGLMIHSHDLDIDRERLEAAIFATEMEITTCIGNGLAVPHCVCDQLDRLVGVVGIHHQGLPFNTPDGRPVHCVVMLASPPDEQDRYQQVLAHLVRSVGTNRKLQHLLYKAQSPAHVCEILLAEDPEDLDDLLAEAAN